MVSPFLCVCHHLTKVVEYLLSPSICHLFTWILHFLSRWTFYTRKDSISRLSLEQSVPCSCGRGAAIKSWLIWGPLWKNSVQISIGWNLETSARQPEASPKCVVSQLSVEWENWGFFSPFLHPVLVVLPKSKLQGWRCLLSFSGYRELGALFSSGLSSRFIGENWNLRCFWVVGGQFKKYP